MRAVLSVLILLAAVAWIVLSYVPRSAFPLPSIAFPDTITAWLFPVLAGLSILAFLALQLWLAAATDVSVRTWQRRAAGQLEPIRLNRSAELLWTALPIVMTFALAIASYRWWMS